MIFLTILKIIGWVLLGLLALILLIVALLLFVPFRYRLSGSIGGGKWDIDGKITWLLHLVRLVAYMREQQPVGELRILWLRWELYPGAPDTDFPDDDIFGEYGEDGLPEESSPTKPDQAVEDAPGTEAGDSPQNAEDKVASGESFRRSAENNVSGAAGEEKTSRRNRSDKGSGRRMSFIHKIQGLPKKIRGMFTAGKGMIREGKNKSGKIQRMWQDDRNRQAFAHLKDEAFYLLRHMRLRKWDMRLRYSTGSPDTTGIALGILACFPVAYHFGWDIIPDFESESAYAEGESNLKGRLRLVHVLISFLGLLFDRNCRRLKAWPSKIKE